MAFGDYRQYISPMGTVAPNQLSSTRWVEGPNPGGTPRENQALIYDNMRGTSTTGVPEGTGTGGPFDIGSTQAETPFGRSFDSFAWEQAFNNPEAVIQNYFDINKLPEYGGGLALAQSKARQMQALWLLMQDRATMGGFPNYLDWAGKYLQSGLNSGGPGIGAREVVGSIFNSKPGDPLFEQLFEGTEAPEQVSNTMSLLRYGLQGALPGPILNSYLNRINRLGNEFMAARLRDPQGGGYTFRDYLNQQGAGMQVFR